VIDDLEAFSGNDLKLLVFDANSLAMLGCFANKYRAWALDFRGI